MGGGDPAGVSALRAFGDAYGIAFQMKDDLLDITADERSLGKPVGNDLTERKMTIPLIEALASGDGNFRREVRSFYDGSANEAIPAIVQEIERQGGLSGTYAQIVRYVEQAKAALEPIAQSAAKERLTTLADALLAE
jgi:geranylgeranyl pyrophosphate synthase